MRMKAFVSGWLLLIATASAADAACTRYNPCPVITFNPAMPSELDNTPVGTVVTRVSVTLNPASAGPFTGTLHFASPYGNDGGLLAMSGNDVVLVKPFPVGDSVQNATVLAIQ